MKDVTIYQVAARAGVSISTVSLVINRPEKVSDRTRQKVLAAVDDLGYVPKASAVITARRGVGRIGVIAPFTSHATYARRLNGILAVFADRPSDVLVFDHESAASSHSPLLGSLPMSQRVDGLVIMGLPLQRESAARLADSGMPTVLVDVQPVEGFSSVVIDDREGGRILAEHLLDAGHRRIAYLSEGQRSGAFVSAGQQRQQGIADAITARGGDPTLLDHVSLPATDVGSVGRALGDLLSRDAAPTAVVAHYDELAASVLAAIDAGPGDGRPRIAVAGFDDGPLAAALGLTTVRQPFEESGRIAAGLLDDQLTGRSTARQSVSLSLELIPRRTA